MCQKTRFSEKVKTAKVDIIVYKVVMKCNETKCSPYVYDSFVYEKDVVAEGRFTNRAFNDAIYRNKIIRMRHDNPNVMLNGEGLHSFQNSWTANDEANVYSCIAAEFIIPAGSKYIAGNDGQGRDTYVSTHLTFKKYLTRI